MENLKLLRQKINEQLLEIAARARGVLGFCAVDLTTQERFALHADNAFPQASAIKIPILMEIYRQAAEGKFQLTDLRRIEATDKTPGSGVLHELGNGSVTLSLRDLCVLMIVLSDNTATNVLMDLAGRDNINQTMQSLGCKQTFLQRRMMDLPAAGRGEENLSSPADAARLLEILYRGEFINRAACEEILAILKKAKTTAISAALPEGVPIASKPGHVAGATTEWAIIYLKNRPYILTVMENYGFEREVASVIQDISRVLYNYHFRLSRATSYGVYIPPADQS